MPGGTLKFGQVVGNVNDPIVIVHVMLRPPTAACVSSKVILCAEWVKLTWNENLDCDDDVTEGSLRLDFFDISQVVANRRRHASGKGRSDWPTLSAARISELPALSEVNAEL